MNPVSVAIIIACAIGACALVVYMLYCAADHAAYRYRVTLERFEDIEYALDRRNTHAPDTTQAPWPTFDPHRIRTVCWHRYCEQAASIGDSCPRHAPIPRGVLICDVPDDPAQPQQRTL